ncbi:MAG TPA: WYL domain-containing protein [Ilumatobacteraceae bacterium]|nr:WYL domain-containing protein [Ilumatobacteraceae bacterium]
MSGPRNAEQRLRRLLVMLPWLMEVGEVPLADVARRYGLTEAQVERDLELVAMCGLPPFVDELIDVFVDDGMVYVGVPRLFTRPLRLTAPEGFTLLAAGRAAMELPGADPTGPLGRGLDKLARALGEAGLDPGLDAGGDSAGVVVDLARPALADELVEAAVAGAELRVAYYTPARDEVAERTIVPRHVFVDSGHWYVLADDERTGERRTFRIDRIESTVPTGVTRPAAGHVAAPDRFFVDAEVPRATLRLAPAAQWVIEEYPVDSVEELQRPRGWVRVQLPVSSDRWLATLLLRLGPDASLVGSKRPAAVLARRILEGYERTQNGSSSATSVTP